MTDRYESRTTTHADDCWSWGPAHYECAVREVEALRAEVERLQKPSTTFRGHPVVWRNDMWVYEDNGLPIPGWGGEVRPCAVCGQREWSGDGAVDKCLGLLPGVSNACCGHGDPTYSYIQFTNGLLIRGFRVVEPRKSDSPFIAACDADANRELLAERDKLAAALKEAQMGLRYAVRVWVLSDEIMWSEEEIDEAVERIIGDAQKEAGND